MSRASVEGLPVSSWGNFPGLAKLADYGSSRVWKSVGYSRRRWTFYRYRGTRVWPVSGTGRPDRSRLSPVARALVEPLKRLQARGEAITAKALAREAGVHPTTASRWLQRMRG